MKIYNLNVNRFAILENYKYNQSSNEDKKQWYKNVIQRKANSIQIANYLSDKEKDLDIIFLQEVDLQNNFEEFAGYFVRYGYRVHIPQGIAYEPNVCFCNMLISKSDIDISILPNTTNFPTARWLEIKVQLQHEIINILNIHSKDLPIYREPLQQYILKNKDEASLIVGDFGAAKDLHRSRPADVSPVIRQSNEEFFRIFKLYQEISDEEMTYYSYQNLYFGSRLDHCFASNKLSNRCKCITDKLVNSVVCPNTGLTDHCGLLVEIV